MSTYTSKHLVSRIEPAKDDAFGRYVAGVGGLLRGRRGWEAPLGIDYDSTGAPAIMIERALSPAAEHLARDPHWTLAYRDAMASVFFPQYPPPP